MITSRRAIVLAINNRYSGLTEITVRIQAEQSSGADKQKAYNYDKLTGEVCLGDEVLLNTTAVAKNLGTGGAHFVMANITRPEHDASLPGHIMKLRYSPCQVKVLSAEEPESPVAGIIKNTSSLAGTPVVVGALHSMLAHAAAGIKTQANGKLKVVYVMTDGAALPLALSNLVRQLKEAGLIDSCVTCGHAFGGDWECVNIYTALLTAKAVAGADIIIALMGPGIVGTASPLGFTGVEQGELVNAVNILEGMPVAIPRISFADSRERHYGLSHHTITSLGRIAITPCTVVIPELPNGDQKELLKKQISFAWPEDKHSLAIIDGQPALDELEQRGVSVTSMGRMPADDPAFFLASGAAGIYAARSLYNTEERVRLY